MQHEHIGSDERFRLDPARTFLGRGADANVWRSPDGSSVIKQYLDDDLELAGSRARLEYKALNQARQALEPIDGVTCPQPYFVDHNRAELHMEYRDAVHLDVALGTVRFGDPAEIQHLAELLVRAIERLTNALSKSQLDFSVRNTLVSRDGSEITLIDFASRISKGINTQGTRANEVALASFLSSTITYQLHQETFLRMTASRRLRMLSRALFLTLGAQVPVDSDRVKTLAWQYYWRQSGNRGWKRYLWFKTFGALLFWVLLERATRPARTSPEPEDSSISSQQKGLRS